MSPFFDECLKGYQRLPVRMLVGAFTLKDSLFYVVPQAQEGHDLMQQIVVRMTRLLPKKGALQGTPKSFQLTLTAFQLLMLLPQPA